MKMKVSMSELHGLPKIFIAIGAPIILIGVFLGAGGLPWITNSIVKWQIQLKNGTYIWDQWEEIRIPLYIKIRIFNITNPVEMSKGENAKLIEMGPYVYRKRVYKVNITVNEPNATVRYKQITDYFFESQMSKGRESDKVTIINIPYVTSAKIARETTDVDFMLKTFDEMLIKRGERLTRTVKVRELLFDGFSIKTYIDLLNDPFVQSSSDVPPTLPPEIIDGKVAMLKGKNGSNDGWIEVHSGIHNYIDFGRIASFNWNKSVSFWKDEHCNKINGTDIIFYQPFIEQKETLIQAYVPTFCRSISFEPEEDPMYHGIVPTIRYRLARSMFMSVKNNPDNWCFCAQDVSCDINGFINIAPGASGAPIFISIPHFGYVEEEYRQRVDGLNFDPELHEGFMDLQATSGITFETVIRIQFNIKITKCWSMPTFANVKDQFLPIMWVEENAKLVGLTKYMLTVLSLVLRFWWLIGGAVVILGGALIGLAFLVVLKRRMDSSESQLSSAISTASSTFSKVKEPEKIDKPEYPDELNSIKI